MNFLITRAIGVVIFLFIFSGIVFAQEPLESFDFEKKGSLKKDWKVIELGGDIERVKNPEGDGWCVKITRSDKNAFARISQKFSKFSEDVELRIEADIKAGNIVAGKGTSYHKGQLQGMILEKGEEISHPNEKFVGTFNFQTKIVYIDVKKNQELVVRAGLQNASGTMWIDNIKIFLEK